MFGLKAKEKVEKLGNHFVLTHNHFEGQLNKKNINEKPASSHKNK